jgi:hypothetical protein
MYLEDDALLDVTSGLVELMVQGIPAGLERERRCTSATAHPKRGNVGILGKCHGAVGRRLRSRRDRQ